MQLPNEAPRSGLTVAQVVDLIELAPAITVGRGCELVDLSLAVLADLTPEFLGGAVKRQAYATLHGSASLAFSTELDWGRALIRPYMTITDGIITARFNLGAYYPTTPERVIEEDPPTFEVEGHDILLALNDRVGESYAVAAGASPLAEVEAIMLNLGVTAYDIDPTASDRTLPSARTWAMSDDPTWLNIINDLLGSVGYMGAWSNWDGRIQCVPYTNPRDRSAEWTYSSTDAYRAMLSRRRTVANDFFEAPNRWVAVRANNVDGPTPVEGDGIYTWQNDTYGPTSVLARGRVITAPTIEVDAADQSALVAAVDAQASRDMSLRRTISTKTSPNPLHWHFDRMFGADPATGSAAMDVLGTSWTLPLDGADMDHEWSEV